MIKLTKSNIVVGVLLLLSVGTLASTAYFVNSIDVITNWKLILPEGEIHAGQNVIVKSEYTKLRDVDGESKRYIECWTPTNILVSYPINEAVADRQAGTGGTGIVLAIPPNIPNTPAKCRFRVSISYPVLPLKKVPESNTTAWFTLLPFVQASSETDVPQATTQSDQPQGIPVSRSQSVVGSSSLTINTTPEYSPSQPDTSQPQPVNPQPTAPVEEVQPSLIDQLLSPITNLLRRD